MEMRVIVTNLILGIIGGIFVYILIGCAVSLADFRNHNDLVAALVDIALWPAVLTYFFFVIIHLILSVIADRIGE